MHVINSNADATAHLGKCKRYSQKEKKHIDVPQPYCFGTYNKYMGGVDLLDRFISQYRPTISARKWYWPLYKNFLVMAVVAAWRVYLKLFPSATR